jgi:hypothetical protein
LPRRFKGDVAKANEKPTIWEWLMIEFTTATTRTTFLLWLKSNIPTSAKQFPNSSQFFCLCPTQKPWVSQGQEIVGQAIERMVNGRLGVLSRGIVLTGESEEAAGPRPKVSTGFLSLFHTNMDRMDITCGNLLSMYISWIYIHSYHCYIHIYPYNDNGYIWI